MLERCGRIPRSLVSARSVDPSIAVMHRGNGWSAVGFVGDLVRWPVIQAPMGGGPGRPELAAAVSNAGGMGFLAAGYKTADEMLCGDLGDEAPHRSAVRRERVRAVRPASEWRGAAGVPRRDRTAMRWRRACSSDSSEWSDDDWEAKLTGLVQHPVAVVSFAFGCPSREVVSELHRVGTRVMVTITNPGDASLAVERGIDALCVQGIEAGAHRGGFTDDERDDGYGLLALTPRCPGEDERATGRRRSDHGRPRPGCGSRRRRRRGTARYRVSAESRERSQRDVQGSPGRRDVHDDGNHTSVQWTACTRAWSTVS